VLIAISTYTEPVAVNTAVSEPPQTREPEENEEPGEFAKLLAGLLQKHETGNVPPADFSDIEADSGVFMFEETDVGSMTDLFGVTGKLRGSFSDSDAEISEEQFSVNAGHLFAGSFEPDVVDVDADDYLPEISNLTIADNLPEAEPDFLMLDSTETATTGDGVTQIAGTDAAAQSAMQSVAPQSIEESLHGASGKKESLSKDRSLSKNEDAEELLSKAGRSDEIASLRGKPESEAPAGLMNCAAAAATGLLLKSAICVRVKRITRRRALIRLRKRQPDGRTARLLSAKLRWNCGCRISITAPLGKVRRRQHGKPSPQAPLKICWQENCIRTLTAILSATLPWLFTMEDRAQ